MSPEIWQLADRRGLQGLITELEGTATRAAGLLESITAEFENQKVRARREGKTEPTEFPPDLAQTAAECQARADLLALELEFVRERLKEAEAREEKKKDEGLLRFGPIGSGKGDPLREIDFQPVKADADGVLIIDCPKSPYHEMRVVDYREKVCKPFVAWKRRPLSPEEKALGASAPPRGCFTISWEDLPPRPGGV
jgi:hypothetical protein